MKNKIFATSGLLCLLIGASFITIYYTDKYILTANFYIANGDIFDEGAAKELQIYYKLQEWIYFFSAVYLVIKIGIISILLSTALYLNNYTVSFWKITNVVVASEFIFLIPAALKILHFYQSPTPVDKESWNHFYFLSAMQFFDKVPADWILVFQTLNLFEITYWFLLAYGIYKISKVSFDRSLHIVLISYVPALCIWVVTITFCSVMLFPQNG
jgi:hypothetical protein